MPSKQGSSEDRRCEDCGAPIRAFDGGVNEWDEKLGRRVDRHGSLVSDGACLKVARKDYARIAALFNETGYGLSRAFWGEYMMATHDLPEEKRKELDAILLPHIHALDEALREAWSA